MLPKGIIAIACSPYNHDMTFDFESLERQVQFIVKSGAHGIAFPVIASEFHVLSDEEHKKAVETVIRAAEGTLPVCVGITGQNIHHSLALAAHAQEAGADGLICMTPVLHSLNEARTHEFFHMLNDRVSIPVMIQNAAVHGMSPLPIPQVLKLIEECDNITCLKEEAEPPIVRMEQAIREGKDVVEGVYGGHAGIMLLDELDLGAAGSLVASHFVDILARVYDAWVAGDKNTARTIFQRLLPAIVYETKLFPVFSLTVLQKRGIIRHSKPRSIAIELSERLLEQVDAYIDSLSDLTIQP